MVRRHDLVILGCVVAGAGVVLAADVFGEAIELLGAQVGRGLEHHVLEEMGEARAAGRVVAAADAVPDLHADRRAGVALDREHLQAIAEAALAIDDRLDLERRCRAGRVSGLRCGKRVSGFAQDDGADEEHRGNAMAPIDSNHASMIGVAA